MGGEGSWKFQKMRKTTQNQRRQPISPSFSLWIDPKITARREQYVYLRYTEGLDELHDDAAERDKIRCACHVVGPCHVMW
jgi:hypothetical protein